MSFLSILFTFLLGVVAGICLVAAVAWYFLSHFFHDPGKDGEKQSPEKPEPATFQLPPVLQSKISDESCKSKESCWAFNFVLYFLFRELRNSEAIRRWILRKLSLEFEELLATSVLGKFFSSIAIQNIDVGQNFPIINWIKTSKVELHPVFRNIATLDILADLDYAGGFQFSIQAETHLKHLAYLSIRFNGIKGQARLQFTTEPYAHWSFSFAENPNIDISVVSQLYGKSFNQVTAVISNQLKRSVRKKHTLPMFKVRYKPFFSRIEHIIPALVPNAAPKVETKGSVSVTLMECRGLMSSLLQGNIFATVGAGDLDWIAAYTDEFGCNFIVRDIVYVKTARREANLDFTLAISNQSVIVESLNPNVVASAFRLINFESGDEILAVDGKRVTSIKQCIKNFKNSTSMKVIWRVKRRCTSSLTPNRMDPWPEEALVNDQDQNNQPLHSSSSSTELSRNSKSYSELTVLNNSLHSTPNHSRRGSMVKELGNTQPTNGESIVTGEVNERRTSFPIRSFCSEMTFPGIMKSIDMPCTTDPVFSESFNIDVEDTHRYLNVSIWSAKTQDTANSSPNSSPTSSPNKKLKGCDPDLITFNGHRVVGTLSIPISDIIMECGTTGMGYFVKDYYLSSPDCEAQDAKNHQLSSHSGFEPHMCYGKISLSFLFKSKEDTSKRKDSADSCSSGSVIPHIEIGEEAIPFQTSANNLSPTDDGQPHIFIRTHFRSATICDYCNKKIWLKEAFACRVCNMKCHKKCNERCIANTFCKGEGAYPAIPPSTSSYTIQAGGTPEIVTTESDPTPDNRASGEGSTENTVSGSPSLQPSAPNNGTSSTRRKTLGGILSAVQSRSAQLRRAGSATTLLSPNPNPNSASKSLPPSPQASPTTSRKASVAGGNPCGNWPANPFEILNASGLGSSDADLQAVIDHLVQHPNEDLESVAKETGRDIYCDLSVAERKQKLNNVLNRLQEEINITTHERLALSKEEAAASSSAKANIAVQISKCEEKVHALSLLMLHYCSGLQHVQDLEENEKEEILISSTTEELSENEGEDPDPDLEVDVDVVVALESELKANITNESNDSATTNGSNEVAPHVEVTVAVPDTSADKVVPPNVDKADENISELKK